MDSFVDVEMVWTCSQNQEADAVPSLPHNGFTNEVPSLAFGDLLGTDKWLYSSCELIMTHCICLFGTSILWYNYDSGL